MNEFMLSFYALVIEMSYVPYEAGVFSGHSIDCCLPRLTITAQPVIPQVQPLIGFVIINNNLGNGVFLSG